MARGVPCEAWQESTAMQFSGGGQPNQTHGAFQARQRLPARTILQLPLQHHPHSADPSRPAPCVGRQLREAQRR